MSENTRKPIINLSYWTFPEGEMFTDFQDLTVFEQELKEDYEVNIESQPTDALGGGLYELAIQFITDTDFKAYALEIIRDKSKEVISGGVIASSALLWKKLFRGIQNLFAKNSALEPKVSNLTMVFNDTTIVIYSIYENSISEVTDELVKKIAEHYNEIEKGEPVKIAYIHVPIFNKIDTYAVCAYRVKLAVDENISSFTKSDYFNIWGIEFLDGTKAVYELNGQRLTKAPFYTQAEYDDLLDKKFAQGQ
jgi:hypothetical protein